MISADWRLLLPGRIDDASEGEEDCSLLLGGDRVGGDSRLQVEVGRRRSDWICEESTPIEEVMI